MSGIILDTGDVAVNEMDKSFCHHGDYILACLVCQEVKWHYPSLIQANGWYMEVRNLTENDVQNKERVF